MHRTRKHTIAALRVLTGCARTASEQTIQTVADLLYVGRPKDIRRRDIARRVLQEHEDLHATDEFLDSYYFLDGDVNGEG